MNKTMVDFEVKEKLEVRESYFTSVNKLQEKKLQGQDKDLNLDIQQISEYMDMKGTQNFMDH